MAEPDDKAELLGHSIVKPSAKLVHKVRQYHRSVRHAADLHPTDVHFSIEEHSESESFRIQASGGFRHYPVRPKQHRAFTVVRWLLGVAILVLLLLSAAAGLTLVLIARNVVEVPWWTSALIYQCYPQSFQDTDGDGIGDLQGVLNRSEHFSNIGVDAIWLNPIFNSPQRDNGYDISNYTSINPDYGNLQDFKNLLKALHDKDIHLLLDFVPNHTSDQHPWFVESKRNRTNPKRDWYIWADGRKGGPPNNWISVFGGSAWTYDNYTNQWYLHQFSHFQPDLNFTNHEVRNEMISVLKFWLDIGVDGFRVDAVKFLLEDPQLRNETHLLAFNDSRCDDDSNADPVCYNSLRHNLTTNYPGIHDIIREWKNVIAEYSEKRKSSIVFIGEVYDNNIDTIMEYYGNQDNEFSFPFNFLLLENTEWSGTLVACIIQQWIGHMPPFATANWVLGNHDNPRIATKVGPRLAKALNTLLLTLPGVATTYYGEEIAMTDVDIPSNMKKDNYTNRDPERTPMQWDDSEYAGFTDHIPWLPVADNYTIVNVKNESFDNNSVFEHYKRLSKIRKEEAIRFGDYACLNASDEILVYARYKKSISEVYIVIINFSPQKVIVDFDTFKLDNLNIVLSSDSKNRKLSSIDSSKLELHGSEAVIVKATASHDISDTCHLTHDDICDDML